MSDILDLDALVPQSVTVKFDGELIDILPPKTNDILRLGIFGQKLQDVNKLTDIETESLVNDLTQVIYKCIPQLADKQFNTAQLLKLIEIINEMAIPPDAKELQKRGITVGGDSEKKDQ